MVYGSSLLIIAFWKSGLYLISVVAVQTLGCANPQIATTVCQQTRYRVATQAVTYAQCFECDFFNWFLLCRRPEVKWHCNRLGDKEQ